MLQVSGSKIWQMERSCNCCQESGEREATVVLFCPKAKNEEKRFRKVSVHFNKINFHIIIFFHIFIILNVTFYNYYNYYSSI